VIPPPLEGTHQKAREGSPRRCSGPYNAERANERVQRVCVMIARAPGGVPEARGKSRSASFDRRRNPFWAPTRLEINSRAKRGATARSCREGAAQSVRWRQSFDTERRGYNRGRCAGEAMTQRLGAVRDVKDPQSQVIVRRDAVCRELYKDRFRLASFELRRVSAPRLLRGARGR